MNSLDNNKQSQRFTPYRAVIPFYILYDLDLNANHLRLYGQIEQMESNPDPNVNASFSYAWLGEQLGINRRNAMKTAKVLIDKGYIEHKEVKKGKYVWNTKKKPIIIQDDDKGCLPETPPQCLPETPPSVSQRHPKIPEDKIPESKQKPIVDFEKSTNYKDDELFMQFYSIYPNKEKPKIARKAFYKHHPDQEFVSMLCADVCKRVENNWKNRPTNKIPHPSTYLNGKEWEGEIYSPESNISKFPNKPPRYTMTELMEGVL